MSKSWKTTSAGILAIVAGVSMIVFAHKPLSQEVIMGAVTSVLTGIGLLFAKDSNVTGGTTQQ